MLNYEIDGAVIHMEEVYDQHHGWSGIVLGASFEDAQTFLESP